MTNLIENNLNVTPSYTIPFKSVDTLINADTTYGYEITTFENKAIISKYGKYDVDYYENDGTNWIKKQTITGARNIGTKVAFNDEWLALSTMVPGTDVGLGTVEMYHFSNDEWVFHSQLAARWIPNTPPTPAFYQSGFGSSLAFDGDTLYVGNSVIDVYGATTPNIGGIKTYTFNGTTWVEGSSIIPPVDQTSDIKRYATKMVIDGDLLADGRYQNTISNYYTPGRVYISKRENGVWGTPIFIDPPVGKERGFGYSIAVSGNLVFVGTPRSMNTDIPNGSVFIYDCSGVSPVLVQTLERDAKEEFGFGIKVSKDGQYLAIVSRQYGNPEAKAGNQLTFPIGKVSIFKKNSTGLFGVQPIQMVRPFDMTGKNSFGISIAFSNDSLLVTNYSTGAISVFK